MDDTKLAKALVPVIHRLVVPAMLCVLVFYGVVGPAGDVVILSTVRSSLRD